MSWVRVPPEAAHFFLGKSGCAVLLCLVCLTLLASFFLSSHLSFKNMYSTSSLIKCTVMYVMFCIYTCTCTCTMYVNIRCGRMDTSEKTSYIEREKSSGDDKENSTAPLYVYVLVKCILKYMYTVYTCTCT